MACVSEAHQPYSIAATFSEALSSTTRSKLIRVRVSGWALRYTMRPRSFTGNSSSKFRPTLPNLRTPPNDRRDYTYDTRHNVVNVRGPYLTGGAWHYYDVASAFDQRNRRVYKSFRDETTGKATENTTSWFFYYDAADRLTEVRYTPNTTAPATYSVFQLFWVGNLMTLYWQTDYPSVATSKRYALHDESGRIYSMWGWPSAGNALINVWAINPSAWGVDANLAGASVFQPLLFAGQYVDVETPAYENDGVTVHRPELALNGFRTYDPSVGGYLQVDPLVDQTRSSYVYVESDPVGSRDPSGLAEKLNCDWVGTASSTWYNGE